MIPADLFIPLIVEASILFAVHVFAHTTKLAPLPGKMATITTGTIIASAVFVYEGMQYFFDKPMSQSLAIGAILALGLSLICCYSGWLGILMDPKLQRRSAK